MMMALRPVIHGLLLKGSGSWMNCTFLVDTGADKTVISGEMLDKLGCEALPAMQQLGGVGGPVETVIVGTRVLLSRTDGGTVAVEGPFAAFTNFEALELSVVGRDVLNHFSLIVDYSKRIVHLLTGRHRYTIHENP